jgi:hypothetical protein
MMMLSLTLSLVIPVTLASTQQHSKFRRLQEDSPQDDSTPTDCEDKEGNISDTIEGLDQPCKAWEGNNGESFRNLLKSKDIDGTCSSPPLTLDQLVALNTACKKTCKNSTCRGEDEDGIAVDPILRSEEDEDGIAAVGAVIFRSEISRWPIENMDDAIHLSMDRLDTIVLKKNQKIHLCNVEVGVVKLEKKGECDNCGIITTGRVSIQSIAANLYVESGETTVLYETTANIFINTGHLNLKGDFTGNLNMYGGTAEVHGYYTGNMMIKSETMPVYVRTWKNASGNITINSPASVKIGGNLTGNLKLINKSSIPMEFDTQVSVGNVSLLTQEFGKVWINGECSIAKIYYDSFLYVTRQVTVLTNAGSMVIVKGYVTVYNGPGYAQLDGGVQVNKSPGTTGKRYDEDDIPEMNIEPIVRKISEKVICPYGKAITFTETTATAAKGKENASWFTFSGITFDFSWLR